MKELSLHYHDALLNFGISMLLRTMMAITRKTQLKVKCDYLPGAGEGV